MVRISDAPNPIIRNLNAFCILQQMPHAIHNSKDKDPHKVQKVPEKRHAENSGNTRRHKWTQRDAKHSNDHPQ